MKTHHIWVLGILLLGICVLALAGQFRKYEGFASEPSAATATIALPRGIVRCPPLYKFFSAPDGTSLCCNGTVNPYTGQCQESEIAKNNICSLGGGSVKDPRPTFRGEMLKSCKDIITRSLSGAVVNGTCPPSLPNFAQEDADNEKCCANPVVMKGETGYTCSSQDLADTKKYCVAKGVPKKNATDGKTELLCTEQGLLEKAVCPTDVTGKTVFQTVPYTMGKREADRYGIADLNGLTIPTCYRLNEACVPEEAIGYAQARGAYTEYNVDNWEYSCKVWTKKNRGQQVSGMQQGYMTPLASS